MSIVLIITALCLLLIILVFLLPEAVRSLTPVLVDRFFLGRLSDERQWGEKVLAICLKWARRMPTVRKDDVASLWIVDLFRNQKKDSIQVWQSASLYMALKESDASGSDESVRRAIETMESDCFDKYSKTAVRDSEYGMLAYAMYDKKEFDALKQSVLQYTEEYRSAQGMIFYKAKGGATAYVDTLGFICPFLVRHGIAVNDDSYIVLAKKQIELYLQYGTEQNCGLPFHAFGAQTHIHRGICDWARGLAWLLIGLMDSYLCLASAGRTDSFFEEQILRYAQLLLKYQHKNGGFSWQLLSGGITDSSAAAVFGWFLACCRKISFDPVYSEAAKKCRAFLMKQTRSNGVVDFCQGDTIGIGCYSRSFGKMPFAQAFALRMQNELENNHNTI